MISTFEVHQISVNEIKSWSWYIQKAASWAQCRQFPMCFCLQKIWIIELSVSRPAMFWEPLQSLNNSSLSWQSGNIISKFPMVSHAHNRACFQAMRWRISCHGNVQSTSPGGPTMERSNRRITISILHRSCLYTFLCAAPKQATGVTMASNYLHSNSRVDQKGSVCIKRFRRSLKVMCQIWGVIASICCAKHASQPFMCRATVKDFNYLSISKRHVARTLWLSCQYFLFSPRSNVASFDQTCHQFV